MADIERKAIDIDAVKQCGLPCYWVLGGPCSGRSTQCEYFARVNKLVHLSSGELLRKEVMAGTQRGVQLYTLMEAGDMVPSEIVLDLVAEAMVNAMEETAMVNAMEETEQCKGFLLDGYPYKLKQAEAFEELLFPPKKIIYLSLEEKVMINRLVKRGNFDDVTRKAIKKRCAAFQKETRTVLEKYKDKVLKIDANDTCDKVTADIAAKLEELK